MPAPRESGNCVEVDLFDENDNVVTGYIYVEVPDTVFVGNTAIPLSKIGPWNSPYHSYHWI